MDNYKVMGNYILPLEIIMLENSNLIKNKGEVYIDGQVNSLISMKENSNLVKEMAGEHFGGRMVVGMKETLKMEFNVVKVPFTDKAVIKSIKEVGKMECLMVKVSNILIMVKAMKATLRKISFMVMVCSIKMIPSFMVFGKIISCLL